jgi:glyoxylase I family protein
MPVTGIGGVFFRCRDPHAIAEWYQKHFGIGDPNALWVQQSGPTVFAPFKADSDYFAAEKQWMFNLRVADLDGMVAELTANGVEVITNPDWNSHEFGRFARVHDPEGNAIELWEPGAG